MSGHFPLHSSLWFNSKLKRILHKTHSVTFRSTFRVKKCWVMTWWLYPKHFTHNICQNQNFIIQNFQSIFYLLKPFFFNSIFSHCLIYFFQIIPILNFISSNENTSSSFFKYKSQCIRVGKSTGFSSKYNSLIKFKLESLDL